MNRLEPLPFFSLLAVGAVLAFPIMGSLISTFINTSSFCDFVPDAVSNYSSYRGVRVITGKCLGLLAEAGSFGVFDDGTPVIYLDQSKPGEGITVKHEYCHWQQWQRGVRDFGSLEEFECYVRQWF